MIIDENVNKLETLYSIMWKNIADLLKKKVNSKDNFEVLRIININRNKLNVSAKNKSNAAIIHFAYIESKNCWHNLTSVAPTFLWLQCCHFFMDISAIPDVGRP